MKSRQNHYHPQNLLNTLFDSNASQTHYLFKEVLPQTVADDVHVYQIQKFELYLRTSEIYYSVSSLSNLTKQFSVISAMVFAPVNVIATRISLSINSKRCETPSPPAAPSA